MTASPRARRRRALKDAARCPDCTADVRIVTNRGLITWAEVRHDDTCPWWQARGAHPFRQIKLVPQ